MRTKDYVAAASGSVFAGAYLPAHDEVFDLAESIAADVQALHAYITSVRSAEQADDAVRELLANLSAV
jgi:hypothetical protein